jgi:hypothetical protein
MLDEATLQERMAATGLSADAIRVAHATAARLIREQDGCIEAVEAELRQAAIRCGMNPENVNEMHSGMLGAAIVRIADMVERVEGLERRLEQLVRENMQLLDDSRRYEAEAYEATELARRLARSSGPDREKHHPDDTCDKCGSPLGTMYYSTFWCSLCQAQEEAKRLARADADRGRLAMHEGGVQ